MGFDYSGYGSVEEVVIGQSMKLSEEYDRATAMGVTESVFKEQGHAEIWSAMGKCVAQGMAPEMHNISMFLPGGEWGMKIYGIFERSPYTQNITPHVRNLLAEKWRTEAKEKIYELHQSFTGNLANMDLDKLTSEVQRLSTTMPAVIGAKEKPERLESILHKAVLDIELQMLRHREGGISGIQTGIGSLDAEISGFQPGAFYVVAGRPGMGKTALGIHFALSAALNKRKVLYFTNEMPQVQIVKRLMSRLTGIDSKRINSGDISATEVKRIGDANQEFHRIPFFINDTDGRNLASIISRTSALHRAEKLDMIIVDFVQQIVGTGDTDNRAQELSRITSDLKALALRLGIVVIGLAQLNREVDKGQTMRVPKLSDIKDSGSFEQDADTVIFIHREQYYSKGECNFLLIAKNRHGESNKLLEVDIDLGINFFGSLGSAPKRSERDLQS